MNTSIFKNKTILITGGSGSYGKSFIKKIIKLRKFKKIIIFSRDELKQFEFSNELGNLENVRFLWVMYETRMIKICDKKC